MCLSLTKKKKKSCYLEPHRMATAWWPHSDWDEIWLVRNWKYRRASMRSRSWSHRAKLSRQIEFVRERWGLCGCPSIRWSEERTSEKRAWREATKPSRSLSWLLEAWFIIQEAKTNRKIYLFCFIYFLFVIVLFLEKQKLQHKYIYIIILNI